jgi:hypothetical protein
MVSRGLPVDRRGRPDTRRHRQGQQVGTGRRTASFTREAEKTPTLWRAKPSSTRNGGLMAKYLSDKGPAGRGGRVGPPP